MCVVALFRLFHSQSQIKHTVLIHTVFFVHMMLVNIIWLMLQMYLQVYICQVESLMPGCYITSSATGVFTQHVRLSLSKRREPYTSEGTFVHICFFLYLILSKKQGLICIWGFAKCTVNKTSQGHLGHRSRAIGTVLVSRLWTRESKRRGRGRSPFTRDRYRPRVFHTRLETNKKCLKIGRYGF